MPRSKPSTRITRRCVTRRGSLQVRAGLCEAPASPLGPDRARLEARVRVPWALRGRQRTSRHQSWSELDDVEDARRGTDGYPPLFPPPLAGFKLQRKRSFDELNVDSAERDRYERVSSDPRKSLAPLFSAWHPASNCHFEYFRSAPSRAGRTPPSGPASAR